MRSTAHAAVAGGDAIELQRSPVDEIGGIHFIEAGQPVNACVAGEAEAGFRPGAETQFTAAAEIAAGERDVQPLTEKGCSGTGSMALALEPSDRLLPVAAAWCAAEQAGR